MENLLFRKKLILHDIDRLNKEFNNNIEFIKLLQENNNTLKAQIDNRTIDLNIAEQNIFNHYER